jgi:hypothetical protein
MLLEQSETQYSARCLLDSEAFARTCTSFPGTINTL